MNDRYRQSDAALWPTAQEAHDLDAGRHSSDQYIGLAPQEPDYAGLRPAEPSQTSFHPSDFELAARPSIGKRTFRTVARFFIAVFIGVGSTLAWQSHGDDAKEMILTWAPSLDWLLPVSTTGADRQAFAVPAVTSPELAQQLEPMARNIALALLHLEQLAAKQEQIAQSIAELQAVEQDRQKMSSQPPSRAAPIPPRRPPQPATQSSAVAAPPSGR